MVTTVTRRDSSLRFRRTPIPRVVVIALGMLTWLGCTEEPAGPPVHRDAPFATATSPLASSPSSPSTVPSRDRDRPDDVAPLQFTPDGGSELAQVAEVGSTLQEEGSDGAQHLHDLLGAQTGMFETYRGPWGNVVLTGTVGPHRSLGKLTFFGPSGEAISDRGVRGEQWRGGYASSDATWWHGPHGLFIASSDDQTPRHVMTALESVSQVHISRQGIHVLGAHSGSVLGEGARTELCLSDGSGCDELRALDDVWWLLQVRADHILAFADDHVAGRPALVQLDMPTGSRRRLAWLGHSQPYMPTPLTVPFVHRDSRFVVLQFDSEHGPTEIRVRLPVHDEDMNADCVATDAATWTCGGNQ